MPVVRSVGDVIGLAFVFVCCGLPATLVVIALALWAIERRRLLRAVANTSEDKIQELLRLADQCFLEKPNAAIIEPTGESIGEDLTLIRLPTNLEGFPWGGRCVTVTQNEYREFACSFVDSQFDGIVIKGKRYRTRPVPRRTTKTGKRRNVYDSAQLLSASPQLKAALIALYPKAPGKFLECIRPTSSESARVGGYPAWLQDPEFHKCPVCKRQMALILQLTSDELQSKSEIVYFLGCRTHLDSTVTAYQFD